MSVRYRVCHTLHFSNISIFLLLMHLSWFFFCSICGKCLEHLAFFFLWMYKNMYVSYNTWLLTSHAEFYFYQGFQHIVENLGIMSCEQPIPLPSINFVCRCTRYSILNTHSSMDECNCFQYSMFELIQCVQFSYHISNLCGPTSC